MPMRTAASVKLAMSRVHGDALTLRGAEYHVFPGPARLAELEAFPGVPPEKMARLRGVARAALDGKLDAATLRAMPESAALHELQRLRGVGPWAASHIYFRGAAPVDALPLAEPRVLHGLAHVLGASAISPEEFVRRAERFRPFRMWVAVLLSRHLARTDGWRAPSLGRERARAGRALSRRLRRGSKDYGESAA
jgi:DNA-3-methyladenine glycosylase II